MSQDPVIVSVKYQIIQPGTSPLDVRGHEINVECTSQLGSEDEWKWAIRCGGSCLTRSDTWAYEVQPSSRTSAFLKKTRFSKTEALARAMYFVQTHEYSFNTGWIKKGKLQS